MSTGVTFAESEDAKNDPPSLTVHYTDGSKQTLTAVHTNPQADPEVEDVELRDEERFLSCTPEWVASQILQIPRWRCGKETSMVNLISSGGGYIYRLRRVVGKLCR